MAKAKVVKKVKRAPVKQNLRMVLAREKLAKELLEAGRNNFFTNLPTTLEVPLPGYFNDFRGSIKRLSDKSVGSVQVITSHAGTRRASHWHKEDSHLCFVVSGEIEYLARPVGSAEAPTSTIFTEGHQFFTGPGVEHEMLFNRDTVFVVLANRHRTPEEYEKDLVRLKSPLKLMPGELAVVLAESPGAPA